MASVAWVGVGGSRCQLKRPGAELVERRAYPAEFIPFGQPYRVLSRSCSLAIACNMAGISCRWAFTGPESDRFQAVRQGRQ